MVSYVLGAEILYHFDAKVLRFFLFLYLKENFLNDIKPISGSSPNKTRGRARLDAVLA